MHISRQSCSHSHDNKVERSNSEWNSVIWRSHSCTFASIGHTHLKFLWVFGMVLASTQNVGESNTEIQAATICLMVFLVWGSQWVIWNFLSCLLLKSLVKPILWVKLVSCYSLAQEAAADLLFTWHCCMWDNKLYSYEHERIILFMRSCYVAVMSLPSWSLLSCMAGSSLLFLLCPHPRFSALLASFSANSLQFAAVLILVVWKLYPA